MFENRSSRAQPGEECARFIETFRRCLAELGYQPGQRVSRGDYTIAVFRSSRAFTAPADVSDSVPA